MADSAVKPTTRRDLRAERERDVAEWCKAHVATLSEDGKKITFGKPGTSVYRQHFRIDGGWLMTYGDVGEAIYQWSSPVTWAFLAGCDLGYFTSKCRASENGTSPKGWDGDVAKARLQEYFEHREERDGFEKTWAEFAEELRWVGLSTRDEWYHWLAIHGVEWFGDDWWESVAVSCGNVDDFQTLCRWAMLRMAVAQLGLQVTHG